MAASPNFVLLNETELAELLNDADSANTKKQIQFAKNRLEAFAGFSGKTLSEVDNYNHSELDTFLSQFYGGLRKDNGELYTKKSMQAIRYGIQRYFQTTKDVNICDSKVYKDSNKTYKAMMVRLKKCGKGIVKHKNAVSAEDMRKIID